MATMNPFDILEDVDNEDPSQLIAAVSIDKLKKAPAPPAAAAAQQAKPAGKLPSNPVPPAQAVREARDESGRGRSRGGGRGYGQGRGGGRGYDQGGRGGGRGYDQGGRGGGRGYDQGGRGGGPGYDQDSGNNEGRYGGSDRFSGDYRHRPSEEGDVERRSERRGGGGPRGPFRGSRHGGLNNGEVAEGERPRRTYDRHSGTGRGNEMKREGSGRGNWGSPTDDAAPDADEAVKENEKIVAPEKQAGEEEPADASKDNKESPVKEAEDNEMTLEEYQKVLEEKRKALLGEMSEERKVEVDKDLKAMQQLSSKKDNHDIFIKLGSEKDKRKDAIEKEERAKKSVSINEFLKPAEGERYFSPGGGRGRRGRGGARGGGGGGGGGGGYRVDAPKIEDPGQFPSLGGGK